MQTLELDRLTGLPPIPAMTNEAEREKYYDLALEAAPKGEVVEFGAWLGASTAYIAAAMRDSGTGKKVHTFDKFLSKEGHIHKVEEHFNKRGLDLSKAPVGDAFSAFKSYLGPLLEYVQPHKGEILYASWGGKPIALIVNDAPKRVPAISAVLTNFREGIRPGTVTAWQDFCHFPSYEIPASLYRLREFFKFREAVYPGSTLVFDVEKVWEPEQVSQDALGLHTWKHDEVIEAWEYWTPKVHPKKREVFRCGSSMFLCDIGYPDQAVETLRQIWMAEDPAVVKKWNYLYKRRPDFRTRYEPLFAFLKKQRAFVQ